jgi:hypothetical protein
MVWRRSMKMAENEGVDSSIYCQIQFLLCYSAFSWAELNWEIRYCRQTRSHEMLIHHELEPRRVCRNTMDKQEKEILMPHGVFPSTKVNTSKRTSTVIQKLFVSDDPYLSIPESCSVKWTRNWTLRSELQLWYKLFLLVSGDPSIVESDQNYKCVPERCSIISLWPERI